MSDRSPIIGSACVETPNGMGGIWHSVPLVKHINAPAHHADEPCRALAEDRLDDLCHPVARDISSDPVDGSKSLTEWADRAAGFIADVAKPMHSADPERVSEYAQRLTDDYVAVVRRDISSDPVDVLRMCEAPDSCAAYAEAKERDISSDPVDWPPPNGAYHWDWCAKVQPRSNRECNCGGPEAKARSQRDISSVTGSECRQGKSFRTCAAHSAPWPTEMPHCVATTQREAVDAFIRDELPGLLAEVGARADSIEAYDYTAAKIAELRKA